MTKVNNVSPLLFPGHISKQDVSGLLMQKGLTFSPTSTQPKKPPEHPMLRPSPLLRLNRHDSGGLLKQKWIKPALTDDTCYSVTRLLLLYCTYRTRRARGACITLKTQRKQNINHCRHVATNKNDRKETGGRNTALNFTRETTSESKLPQMTSSNSSSWSNNEGGT